MVRLLSAHAWVKSHQGVTALRDGGASLTSAMPSATEFKAAEGVALEEVGQ